MCLRCPLWNVGVGRCVGLGLGFLHPLPLIRLDFSSILSKFLENWCFRVLVVTEYWLLEKMGLDKDENNEESEGNTV